MLSCKTREDEFTILAFHVHVAGAVTLYAPSSVLQRNAGTGQFWPGVLYLVAGSLYFTAGTLGYFLSHFAILSTRDKRTKNFAVILFICIMMLTLLVVGKLF